MLRASDLHFVLIGGPATSWLDNTARLGEAVLGRESPLRSTDGSSCSGTNPGGVVISLGIKRDGSCELLLTADQARVVVDHIRCPPPPKRRSLLDYESVSPITFHAPAELERKLRDMYKKPRSKAKKSAMREAGDEGIARGVFEHGRVLYCVLQGTLDPVKYALPEVTWKRTLRVGSLAFNTRSGDTRPSYERLLYPSLVDIGWSGATVPDMAAKPGSTTHFRVQEQRYMNAGGKEMPFSHGNTEVLDSSIISEKLKEVFAAWTASAHEPMILLVHDERLTRGALKCFGIDTSQWVSGLKDLLGFPSQDFKRESSSSYSRQHSGTKRESYDYGRYRPPSGRSFHARPTSPQNRIKREDPDSYSGHRRSRSPSPRPSIKLGSELPLTDNYRDYSYRPSPSQQWRQNNERTYAPVYVVDVKHLYVNLMRKESGSERTVSIAQRFNMRHEDDGWCAGNEAVLLFQIWHSMISGPPIDEQNKARDAGWMDAPASGQAPQQMQPEDEDDENWDPNDISYDPTAANPAEKSSGLYASDSDDDESDDD